MSPDKDQEPRSDETGEYELGDDFLADLTEDEEVEEEEELENDEEGPDDEEAEELAPEEDLETSVHAETQEWDGLEAAARDADQPTLIASARSKITSGFEAVGGDRITSGFKAVGRSIRLPLWARFLTAAFLIVGSVGTATAASLYYFLPTPDPIPIELPVPEPGAPVTFLILGSDKRPEDESAKFKGLSDTTMLLRVDGARETITLLSLPRDLRVEIPGYGTAKLNEAYASGGPELTLETVEQLTGIEPNHVVDVDFEGFARAVNAIDCVYVDVDRRYFNKNDGFGEEYEEIDLQPGYQALCGFDALDYARYRHTDNDVVRAARQQDFLRQARQKVPAQELFEDREALATIFSEDTRSDISDRGEVLEMVKLLVGVREAPIKEIHFEGSLGPSFVTATQSEIDMAVSEFLGRGPSARDATPSPEPAPEERKTRAAEPVANAPDPGLTETDFGRELARGLASRRPRLPVYYPTVLETGTDFGQKPRLYKINGTGDGSPPDGERAAYKWVFSTPRLGEYYGFTATRWEDPPILNEPSETREIGDREYQLFYDGDRLRLVGWKTDDGSFWLSNTLTQSLDADEMIEIAKGMTELPSA